MPEVRGFRLRRGLLRDDGLLFVNLSDSYAASPGQRKTTDQAGPKQQTKRGSLDAPSRAVPGLEPLNLCNVPARFALAMQAEGWYHRSTLIWAKAISLCPTYSGTVMPESVQGWRWQRHRIKVRSMRTHTQGYAQAGGHRDKRHGNLNEQPSVEWQDCPGCDTCTPTDGYVLRQGAGRPTTSHEFIFMFSKTPRYYYDTEAVREPAGSGSVPTYHPQRRHSSTHQEMRPVGANRIQYPQGDTPALLVPPAGRQLRSVLAVNHEPLKADHYAAWPTKLVATMITLGTSEKGVCPACGTPWARVVDRAQSPAVEDSTLDRYGTGQAGIHRKIGQAYQNWLDAHPTQTLGWRPCCTCQAGDAIPATVLDCFAGSGRTGLVADRLGRHAILVELSAEYIAIQQDLLTQDIPLFVDDVLPIDGDDSPEPRQSDLFREGAP